MSEGISELSANRFYERVQPWVVVFFAASFFFFEFMQVNMFNTLDPYLFKAYHLKDSTQLGHLAANYMYANVLFLIPAGMILDRLSTRWVIIVAMLVCTTCTLLFSLTTQLWQAEVCRFVTGIGGAFCLLSSVRLASRWFPPKKMALVVGLVVTFAMTGAMIAQTPFTLLAINYGWRKTMMVDALSGYVMLTLIMVFVRDYPRKSHDLITSHYHTLSVQGVFKAIMMALKNAQNWIAGIYASLINLPVFLLGSWGMMYLEQIHHLSAEKASLITTAMFVGLILGSPAFGWFSDRIAQRRLPMILGAILSIMSILPIMYLNLNYDELLAMFFLLGFFTSSQIISYAVVAESNPETLTGASEGIASVLIMSGGFLIPVFAQLLDLNWHHYFVKGLPVFSLHAFQIAFLIMPVAFVIALFAAFVTKETYCRSYSEREANGL